MTPGIGGKGGLRKKRRSRRSYQNYRLKYGIGKPEHTATARRISGTGLFIATNDIVYSTGAVLNMEIEIGGTKYHAIGVVRDAEKVDPRWVRILKPGMGVEFIKLSDELRKAIAADK